MLPRARTIGCLVLGGLFALISGCAPTNVRPVTTYGGPPLARPDRVLVVDFAVSPDDVSLNRSLFARLGRQMDGTPPGAEQLKVGREVAEALSEELVTRIRELGLAAERAPGGTPPAPGTVTIEGRFVSVDEGDRLKRIIIGFGAGSTVVRTMAELYVGTASGPVLAQTFETDAKSPRMPGMGMVGARAVVAGAKAVTAGAGAGAHAITEPMKGVVADAQRTAQALARQLGEFFTAQGWIAPGTVK